MSKNVNVRLSQLEQLLIEKIHVEYGIGSNGKNYNTSEIVRYCIKYTAQVLLTEDEYNEIVLHVNK